MKILIFITIFILISQSSNAQNLNGELNIGLNHFTSRQVDEVPNNPNVPTNDYDLNSTSDNSFGFYFNGNLYLKNENLKYGIGIEGDLLGEIYVSDIFYLPIYATTKYKFFNDKKTSPMIKAKLGYGFANQTGSKLNGITSEGGMFGGFEIGIEHFLNSNQYLNTALGVKYINFKVIDNSYGKTMKYNFVFLNLNAGIGF